MTAATAPDKALLPLATSVCERIEALLRGGLTTASQTDVRLLEGAFAEAARLRQPRVAVCLRAAADELARYCERDAAFSARRLVDLLARAWTLAEALRRALEAGDLARVSALTELSPEVDAGRVEVLSLGVVPRVSKGSHVAFEARLRVISSSTGAVERGESAAMMCIVTHKQVGFLPIEALLTVPQPQGFAPSWFVEGRALVLDGARARRGPAGPARLSLSPRGRVTRGDLARGARSMVTFSRDEAAARIRRAEVTPLDLDAELHEDLALDRYRLALDRDVPAILVGDTALDLVVPQQEVGATMRQRLASRCTDASRPPLYGLLHYERARLCFLPVCTIEQGAPVPLLVDPAKISSEPLLRSLSPKR